MGIKRTKLTALKQLGRRLRALRTARGLSQEGVAERAGLSGKFVSELELGKRDVRVSTLVKIAELGLQVGVEDAVHGIATEDRGVGARDADEAVPLPPPVARLARQIATLEPADRRRVLVAVRAFLGMAR